MYYSYEQIGTVCATFSCTPEVKVGQVCHMFGNNCVCMADVDSDFDGVIVGRRELCAAVVVRGFVTVPYTGVPPFVGNTRLRADGTGSVHVANEGKSYLVVNVDTDNQTVTFLM